jgi:hypothetical protein
MIGQPSIEFFLKKLTVFSFSFFFFINPIPSFSTKIIIIIIIIIVIIFHLISVQVTHPIYMVYGYSRLPRISLQLDKINIYISFLRK